MTAGATQRIGDFGADDGLDAIVSALVVDAYRADDVEVATPLHAQSTPGRDDENAEPGHLSDPLDPHKGHRPKPNEPLPLDAPPVPKLRPLE